MRRNGEFTAKGAEGAKGGGVVMPPAGLASGLALNCCMMRHGRIGAEHAAGVAGARRRWGASAGRDRVVIPALRRRRRAVSQIRYLCGSQSGS
jgi:hypothetical protein